jgi:hypothetical protein
MNNKDTIGELRTWIEETKKQHERLINSHRPPTDELLRGKDSDHIYTMGDLRIADRRGYVRALGDVDDLVVGWSRRNYLISKRRNKSGNFSTP